MYPGDNLPAKSEIFEHWKNLFPQLHFLIDWSEPGCWACGFHYGIRYNIKRSDASLKTILGCWDKIPLQRCHITPRSLNGTDSVENLFLMCRECHDTMPNTSIPEIFFEWAKAQNSERREDLKIRDALESFGVMEKDYGQFLSVIRSTGFELWMKGKFGIHRPQSNYAPISSRLTPATVVGLAVHYMRKERLAQSQQM